MNSLSVLSKLVAAKIPMQNITVDRAEITIFVDRGDGIADSTETEALYDQVRPLFPACRVMNFGDGSWRVYPNKHPHNPSLEPDPHFDDFNSVGSRHHY